MERKIPLPMLVLAILGFCYLLFPILVVVLGWPDYWRVFDLSHPKGCRSGGSSLFSIPKSTCLHSSFHSNLL